MTTNEKELFEKLIRAAGKLATVSDQAGELLSEQFQTLVQPSVDEVRAILKECPAVTDWDGKLHESDIKEETYPTRAQRVGEPNLGVKLVHLPTGVGAQSETKNSQDENRRIARKGLEKLVAREARNRG